MDNRARHHRGIHHPPEPINEPSKPQRIWHSDLLRWLVTAAMVPRLVIHVKMDADKYII